MQQSIIRTYEEQFGAPPRYVARAPGRINLIGGSTDYNEGFVLPTAVDRAIWAAFSPREDDVLRLFSFNFGRQINLSLSYLVKGRGWQEYVKGVAWALQQRGYSLRGLDIVIGGNIPRGAGLSSSAALEMAAALAFITAAGHPWEPVTMAQAGQQAENAWVGLHCGIMDQLIVTLGQAGHALLIDCRTLNTDPVPLPEGVVIAVLDTTTRRNLPASAYNVRRQECEAAAHMLGVPFLRDATLEMLPRLPEPLRQRARHVVTENARVLRAAEAMRRGDATALGALIDASHDSLRDDFEVSSPALDAMVNCARKHEGCYGARLSGAGYAGCCLALVEEAAATDFMHTVSACYRKATHMTPTAYLCHSASGAQIVSL